MYDIAFSAMRSQTLLYKEQQEALEKFEEPFMDIEFEAETGLPAVARKYGAPMGGDGPFIPS